MLLAPDADHNRSTRMHPKTADSDLVFPSDEASASPESREDDPLIPPDPNTMEKRLVRKLDRRILPILCLLYLFACALNLVPSGYSPHLLADLDRSNLGNARLQGLPEDVLGGDPTGVLFDWLVAMFYIPYVSTHSSGHVPIDLCLVRSYAWCRSPCSPSTIILRYGLAAQPSYGAYFPHRW